MIDKEIKEIFKTGLFRGEIKFTEPMSKYTSLGIGGPAEVMVFPEDPVSLKNVLIVAKRQKIPIFVFGAGTNLLVSDKGIKGIAISLKEFKKIELIPQKGGAGPVPSGVGASSTEDDVTLFVEAGVPLTHLINFTGERGYSGIEALAGIPGAFGGAVYMNAGSFGTEIKDVLSSIAVMDIDGRIFILKKEELRFSYRSSNIPQDMIILSANIILEKDTPENVSERIKEFLKKKRLTQPLKERSAGCVFKNPVGSESGTSQNRLGRTVPTRSYRTDSCQGERYAGRLIDEAGCKGVRVGDVEVSEVHANYFINKGKATCKDFVRLMEIVKNRVREHSGIALEPEIKIVGGDG